MEDVTRTELAILDAERRSPVRIPVDLRQARRIDAGPVHLEPAAAADDQLELVQGLAEGDGVDDEIGVDLHNGEGREVSNGLERIVHR